MSYRRQALWRIWSFLYGMVVGSFVSGVVGLVGLVWGVIDVLWQLVLGSEGLSASSRPATIVYETLHWNLDLYVYAIIGEGSFMWLPDW